MSIDPELIHFYQSAHLTISTPVGLITARYLHTSKSLYQFHSAAGWKSGMFIAAPSLFIHPSENQVISEARYRPRFLASLHHDKHPEQDIKGLYILNNSWREAVALIRATGLDLALFASPCIIYKGSCTLRVFVSDMRNRPLVKSPLARAMDSFTHEMRQKGIRVTKQKRLPKNAPPPRLIASFPMNIPRKPTNSTVE